MYSRLLLQILALLLVATTSPALAIDIPFERGYLTGCSENYSVEGHVQASDPDIELVNRGMGNESVLYKILSGQKIKNRRLAHDGFNAEATQVFYLNEILAMTTGKIPGGAWNNADFYSRMFEIIRFVWNLDPETSEMYLFFQVEKTAKEITDQYPELSSLKMPDHASEKEAQAWYHERFNQLGRMLVLVRDSTLKPPTQKEILDAIAEGFISRGIGMATVAGNKIVDVTMPPDLSWMDEPNVERINPRYPISNQKFEHAMDNLSFEISGNGDFGPIVVEALGLLKSDEERLWLINAIYQFWKSDPTVGFVADLASSALRYNRDKGYTEAIALTSEDVENKFATLKKNLIQWIEMQQSWSSGRYSNDWGNDQRAGIRFIGR